jgi:hypothetical protein
MIILKQVIHYTDTNTVEATWVERTITPQAEVPAVPVVPPTDEVPAVLDDDGNILTPAVPATPGTPEVPAYTPDPIVTDAQVKCHSYDGTQMQMFRDDAAAFGTSLDDYEDMIADIESKIVPYVPPPPVVPTVVTMRQARLALHGAGLLEAVEAAVAGADKAVQIEWEFASELRRDWPTLVGLATALSLTDAQIDGLFTQAAQL